MELGLTETKLEAPGIKSFKFDLHGTQFTYKPGQYISMQLDVRDPRGNARSFSLASSSTEAGFLMVCTRISESPFKQKLNSLETGEKVGIRGPFGRFLLQEDETRHVVMLSGGIGITPFRNMIRFATDQKLKTRITLLYSNRVPEEIVFKEELDRWQAINPNLRIVNTITRLQESRLSWDGRVGRIDGNFIREFVPEPGESIFYVCGPPAMVDVMGGTIRDLRVLDEQVRIEKFTGY